MLGLRRRTADDYEGKRWIFVSYLALENWATLGTWDRIARGLNTGIYIGYMATYRGVFLSSSVCATPQHPSSCTSHHFEVSSNPECLKGSQEPDSSTSRVLSRPSFVSNNSSSIPNFK